MSSQQLIIIFTGAGALIAFAVSQTKIAKVWKIFLSVLFIACIVIPSIINWYYTEKKETKEVTFEKQFEQLDTHLKASMTFEDYIQAARLNKKAGRAEEAILDAGRAIEMDSNSAIALNLLGVLYSEKGENDEAIKIYEKIKKGIAASTITINSGRHIYHTNFGKAYMKKNMWKEAQQEFQQCLALNDSAQECYLYLAKTLDKLNDWEELYNICKKGIIIFPNSAPLHNFLGIACFSMSRFNEAESSFLNAVQADSTFGQPYLDLGVVYFLKKQPEKSARLVEKALRLDPSLAKDVEILRTKKLLP